MRGKASHDALESSGALKLIVLGYASHKWSEMICKSVIRLLLRGFGGMDTGRKGNDEAEALKQILKTKINCSKQLINYIAMSKNKLA